MDKQIKPLKIYPKVNESLYRTPSKKQIDGLGYALGPLPDLVFNLRVFYREMFATMFDLIVKETWLEQQVTYNGARRRRGKNGIISDWSFSYLMNAIVGMSPRFFSGTPLFTIVPTYFKDFFPNFSDHNPFTTPEYYKYPYEHVTLDFLCVVYKHHERIEMLNYAEEKKMNIREFTDWAVNQSMCYNDEVEKDIYIVNRNKSQFTAVISKKR